MSAQSVARQYDGAAEAWSLVMGPHTHQGYFEDDRMGLEQATETLIDRAIAMTHVNRDTRILDVGCGTGETARYLYDRFTPRITGISLSAREIEAARKKAGSRDMTFYQANGLATGFEAERFDLVWIIETGFVIPDLNRLLQEAHRLLVPGGALIMTDAVLKSNSILDNLGFVFRHGRKLREMGRVWEQGTPLRRMGSYYSGCARAGFHKITLEDWSESVLPTYQHWKQRALHNVNRLRETAAGTKAVETFTRGSELMEFFHRKHFLGYMLLYAVK